MSRYLQRPAEFPTRERCHIRELVNDAATPHASLAACRVRPGTTTELHRLSVAEWYAICEGTGLMEVGDDAPFAVAAGDVVTIPAGVAQRIRNTGRGDLVFHCLCVPRFTPECYRPVEGSDVEPPDVA